MSPGVDVLVGHQPGDWPELAGGGAGRPLPLPDHEEVDS